MSGRKGAWRLVAGMGLMLASCGVPGARPDTAGSQAVEQALSGLRGGLDFADALHHASCRGCEAVASFDDRGFTRRARHLNLAPRVFVPHTP